MEKRNLVIIGSGPAGYTAAIYAARAGLRPLLFKGAQPGGQLTITSDVENYPGFPEGITGPEMMLLFEKQAQRFGTEIKDGDVTQVDLSNPPYRLYVDGVEAIEAKAIIVSTGASARWLGIPGEERLSGKGVSACAVCDGFFFKNQTVAVVGGGDSACEEASYLSRLCKKVYILVRKGHMRASTFMQQRVQQASNIEILLHSTPVELIGEEALSGVHIEHTETRASSSLDIQGFFIAIGHTPNTAIFKNQLEMDANGYLVTVPGTSKTSKAGVFATGDVQDAIYRQAVTAAGSGCIGALDAEHYLASL